MSSIPLGSLKYCPLPVSTLADSYKPISKKVKHIKAPPKDNINLDYCPYSMCKNSNNHGRLINIIILGYLTSSTTRESFPQRDAQDVKLKLNQAALKNVSCV